jgi:hypothetical protein
MPTWNYTEKQLASLRRADERARAIRSALETRAAACLYRFEKLC